MCWSYTKLLFGVKLFDKYFLQPFYKYVVASTQNLGNPENEPKIIGESDPTLD
jgi:hypothetical protein